jgi:hypothetical protein
MEISLLCLSQVGGLITINMWFVRATRGVVIGLNSIGIQRSKIRCRTSCILVRARPSDRLIEGCSRADRDIPCDPYHVKGSQCATLIRTPRAGTPAEKLLAPGENHASPRRGTLKKSQASEASHSETLQSQHCPYIKTPAQYLGRCSRTTVYSRDIPCYC